MSAYKDFIAFVDSGSKVPYFMTDCKYVMKPNIISIEFQYDFKTFYKSYNKYYVGVAFSKFVRPITAQDFKMMLELHEVRNAEITKLHMQLAFDL